MSAIGVMQVTDSLLAGGLEQVAVTLANKLSSERFQTHLCVTRMSGPLEKTIEGHVGRLHLDRKRCFDYQALRRLLVYIRSNDIRLLHAHGTSLFLAVLAARFRPYPRVVWHDHFGRLATQERAVWLYRAATRFVSGVIAVSQPLAEWARRRLGVPASQVWYVPNCACEPRGEQTPPDLPGTAGSRIVCVANLRPEKGHACLLKAMRRVRQEVPAAHLLLAGRADGADYFAQIQKEIQAPDLAGHVTWLGSRDDVGALLKACDIGVLSSLSEGLPLALLEYGVAGLPVVATNTGQCREILDHGRVGVLVPSGHPEALANGLVQLLQDSRERQRLGSVFRDWVTGHYSSQQIIPKIRDIYGKLLA